MRKFLLSMMLGFFMILGCIKGQDDPVFPSPDLTIPTDENISLKTSLPFRFGAAVNNNLLKTKTAYRNVVVKECNSVTAENAMKFGQLHPLKDVYTWAEADYLVEFAQLNGMRVHGHTLIWHKSPPAWVENFQGDAAAWDKLLKDHIQTVVGRYKGKVASWDVINEVMEDDGTLRKNSIWYQKLGKDFIAKSFIYAHEADPNALLFYNDYGHEYSTAKRTAILNLISELKSNGVPIHGIGMQFHTNYKLSQAAIETTINSAAATGLKVHIAELDISMNTDNKPDLVFSAGLAQQQKAKYEAIVKVYNAIPKSQQFGITIWNVGDADSWIRGHYNRPDWPLPFDDNYQRKPAYQGILDGVK